MTTQTQLAVGDIAPDFSLTDADGRTVSKADFAGRSFILYFYPKAASPGCTTEACDFRDNLSALAAAGFEVLGISPDDTESLKEFAAEEGLTFSLLSDEGAAVAKAYGSYGQKTVGDHTFQGTQFFQISTAQIQISELQIYIFYPRFIRLQKLHQIVRRNPR